MERTTPRVELDRPYGPDDAVALPWEDAEARFSGAQIYWFTTVRADGRPHLTPVSAIWRDGAAHVTTGPEEQKAKNLAANDRVIVSTGTNDWGGCDIVLEGRATRLVDESMLRRLAGDWLGKYGEMMRYEVRDGAFHAEQGAVHVFTVAPVKAYAYDRGGSGGATRYRF